MTTHAAVPAAAAIAGGPVVTHPAVIFPPGRPPLAPMTTAPHAARTHPVGHVGA